jgi:UDP-GlcNAc3NAcA epimerase
MNKPRLLTVVGARPQFIKAAALSRAFRAAGTLDETIVHTGQHYDRHMSDVFFEELEVPAPSRNLGVVEVTHGAMTGRMLEAIETCLADDRPDAVLVYGDTNSTLAGALAAAKMAIPVIHCEAGLRSGRQTQPEEINRILVDHMSALLLCPTWQALRNLEREGLAHRASVIGDVMYDVALFARARSLETSTVLERLGLAAGGFDVLTLHREENTVDKERLRRLLDYAENAARERPLVLPAHPRTQVALRDLGRTLSGVRIVAPLGYLDFHRLLDACVVVHTDSGGVQKEAYFHRKPCVTLRDETEWTETVEAGWNRLWTTGAYNTPRREISEYGDGRAAVSAAAAIAAFIMAL